jgi:nitrogen fixation/metabolism regulation signal transduction histidine kinase
VVKRLLRVIPAVALVVLLLMALYLVSSVEQEATQLGRAALWIFISAGLALLILMVVIAGRLWRLVQRLRQGQPGARLTARLVAIFVALSLPPVLVLYLFALEFISETIPGWLDVDTGTALQESIGLGQQFIDNRTREASGQLAALAQTLAVDDEDRLFRQLLREVSSAGPTELALLDESGRARLHVHIDPSRLTADLPRQFALGQALQTGQYSALEPTESGLAVRGLVRLEGLEVGAERLLLQGLYPLPADFAARAERIERAYFEFQNVAFLRDRLQQSLILILSLVLLITVLMAIVLGFNAARRLSAPIRDLAAATDELAAGHFPEQLPVTSRDELGFLVESFNTMTHELAASRTALETQRRYLEVVLGRLSAGVMVVDQHGTLTALNESAARILQLDIDHDHGVTLHQLIERRPDLRALLVLLDRQRQAPAIDWRREIQLGGSDRPLVLVCRGTDLPSPTGGHVMVFDDVTVLDEAQREAAWAEVARRLAHEIKNPLTPIQLAAERLQIKLHPVLGDADAQLLSRATDTIRAQVSALKQLVDAFGDYAHPKPPRFAPLQMADLVRSVAELYGSAELPVQFVFDLADDLPELVADAGRLRQVLINLITNAREAHPTGQPRIHIVVTIQEEGGIRLTIGDDGPGIDATLRERIFEPYVTSKPGGTGLGLAIVRRIVEEHGGQIDISHSDGAGTTVIIDLPKRAPGAQL